ncbi:MAG TPA: metallophosphoesterase [Halothiobacillus sp.]|nr:metallophosphoesterase [Halothiobacillus sp.]
MILMFGDIHGDFRHVLPAVAKDCPKAIILLGDIEAGSPLERELEEVMKLTEVWWIPGNHDTDTVENWRNLFQSQLAERNLHGRVVEIDGVRVAGLGGVFRGEVWYPDPADAPFNYESYDDYKKRAEPGRIVTARQAREARKFTDVSCLGKSAHGTPAGKLLTHRSTIFYKDWFELYGRSADILVTHEAPGCHPHGFKVLTELARSMKVKFSFHGHHHDSLNYSASFAEMGHRAYGVGLRGITDMYGGQIRVGAYEEQRVSRGEKD